MNPIPLSTSTTNKMKRGTWSLRNTKSKFTLKAWKRRVAVKKFLDDGASQKETMKHFTCGSQMISECAKLKWEDFPEWAMKALRGEAPVEKQREDESARAHTNLNLNAVEFIEDKDHLNCTLFPMQRLILKAFYGIAFDEDEQKKIDELVKAGKCTWKSQKEYRELVLVCGMKGSKTRLGGFIECYEDYELYKHEDFRAQYGLPKGKEVLILNVATNADQAKRTVFAEVKSIIKNAPFYQRRTFDEIANCFSFETGVDMQSGHSNSSAMVGPLCKAVVYDEMDRFTSNKDGRSSGKAVYEGTSRNVSPFQMKGKLIDLSSPMSEDGPIMELFEKSKTEETMLGFWLTTWEMNPNIPFEGEMMQAELRKNPEAFWRDYGAMPSKSLEKYYRAREKIDSMFARGKSLGLKSPLNMDGTLREDLKGDPKYDYHIHMDPAINNCSFGLGLSHKQGEVVLADAIIKISAATGGEIDYQEIESLLLLLCERFPTIRTVTYDTYLAVSLYQAVQRKLGIEAEFFHVDKDAHDKLKIEGIYADKVACHAQHSLRQELRDLELINGKRVDHPTKSEAGGSGTKDVADALAGSFVASIKDETAEPVCVASEAVGETVSPVSGEEATSEFVSGGVSPSSETGQLGQGESLIW